ncbi:NDH subcomplex B4 [Klebsormidium nitens]|uniref:NDH subcomplex B4 n=1 Tax=Klebsormidium nitens TaxID=105231 RepID=A0A1Y1I516_KLENI|nr:NDH subcomplex B4 [Klebsormidium nitens]|eukprot:GAQ86045.1 NDH subcomplex B4 [Klebsormidium nitens]
MQVRGWGLPLNTLGPRIPQPRGCRRAVVSCDARQPHKSGAELPEKRSRGGFRLQSVAWLPLVLAMASETMTGEIHVDPSMDFYTDWHFSQEFIKHFYVAFICCFSFGCVYFGSLKDPFYEGPESGYREDGGNGTAHWFYDVKEEEEEASREQLAKQVLALEMAQKEKVVRQLEEQLTVRADSAEPKETVSSLYFLDNIAAKAVCFSPKKKRRKMDGLNCLRMIR